MQEIQNSYINKDNLLSPQNTNRQSSIYLSVIKLLRQRLEQSTPHSEQSVHQQLCKLRQREEALQKEQHQR